SLPQIGSNSCRSSRCTSFTRSPRRLVLLFTTSGQAMASAYSRRASCARLSKAQVRGVGTFARSSSFAVVRRFRAAPVALGRLMTVAPARSALRATDLAIGARDFSRYRSAYADPAADLREGRSARLQGSRTTTECR